MQKKGKIGIGVIHGMGDQKSDFAFKFIERVKRQYTNNDSLFENDDLYFEPVYWADVLSSSEELIIGRANYNKDLSYIYFRQFAINYLGDPIAYQKTREKINLKEDDSAIYFKIQDRVNDAISKIKINTADDAPIILIGHSLGAIILLNYIYDSQKSEDEKNKTGNIISEVDNLAGLITMGNPFAIWSLRYADFGSIIKFPGNKIKGKLKETAKWYNYYGRHDILAYPLKRLNNNYNECTFLEDVKVSVGGILLGWTPFSHLKYFDSRNIAHRIAGYLREVKKSIIS